MAVLLGCDVAMFFLHYRRLPVSQLIQPVQQASQPAQPVSHPTQPISHPAQPASQSLSQPDTTGNYLNSSDSFLMLSISPQKKASLQRPTSNLLSRLFIIS